MLLNFKDSRFWRYYPYIWLNKIRFERMLDEIEREANQHARYEEAKRAANFAYLHSTGYLSSYRLERIFLQIAETLPMVECLPQKGTVLHVLTAACNSGGHTRVVQRWIELSPKEEKHSIILLNQYEPEVPQWLVEAVHGHNGKVYQYEKDTDINIAIKLREQASHYERIILHVFIDDPIPLLAFGTKSFTTPIIFFNHADHLFWLGVSISDMVADLVMHNITYRRGVSNSMVLGIPPAESKEVPNYSGKKEELRKELGIPQDAFVLVSVGTKYKYNPVGGFSFPKEMSRIFKRASNIYCYVIGPDGEEKYWKRAKKDTGNRIITLGEIYNKELFYKYLSASDLYVGSFPMGSGTAMQDGVQCGVPFIQFSLSSQADFLFGRNMTDIEPNRCFISNRKEFRNKVLACAKDKNQLDIQYQESLQMMNRLSNKEIWLNSLTELYAHTPQRHKIHSFSPIQGKDVVIDDRAVVSTAILNAKWESKWGIDTIFTIVGRKIRKFFIHE